MKKIATYTITVKNNGNIYSYEIIHVSIYNASEPTQREVFHLIQTKMIKTNVLDLFKYKL